MAVAARTKTAVRARTETFFMEASLKKLQDPLKPKRRLPPEGNAVGGYPLQRAFHRRRDTRNEHQDRGAQSFSEGAVLPRPSRPASLSKRAGDRRGASGPEPRTAPPSRRCG